MSDNIIKINKLSLINQVKYLKIEKINKLVELYTLYPISKCLQDKELINLEKLIKKKEYNILKQSLLENINNDKNEIWILDTEKCPVCLEEHKQKIKLNTCQHLVCLSCIQRIINEKQENADVTCPICRCKIIGYEKFDLNNIKIKYINI